MRRGRTPGVFIVLPLAGHSIAVAWVDGLCDREELAGRWIWDKGRIDLDGDLTRTEAQEYLIHESAHAVSDILDLGLTEAQIRALGVGLQQMLAPFLKVIR